MGKIVLKDIRKAFGDIVVIPGANLTIANLVAAASDLQRTAERKQSVV